MAMTRRRWRAAKAWLPRGFVSPMPPLPFQTGDVTVSSHAILQRIPALFPTGWCLRFLVEIDNLYRRRQHACKGIDECCVPKGDGRRAQRDLAGIRHVDPDADSRASSTRLLLTSSRLP